ncbi:MAG: hypothetical protein GX286_02290 [Clostridiales bacterium]|jgi:GTPase SAR1 family protein|nr:hypothetical protein [Clostridiales bacterium]
MSQLSQVELQSLRHLISSHENSAQKFETYAQQSTDPQIRSYFEKAAREAQQTKQKLMSFLN